MIAFRVEGELSRPAGGLSWVSAVLKPPTVLATVDEVDGYRNMLMKMNSICVHAGGSDGGDENVVGCTACVCVCVGVCASFGLFTCLHR